MKVLGVKILTKNLETMRTRAGIKDTVRKNVDKWKKEGENAYCEN